MVLKQNKLLSFNLDKILLKISLLFKNNGICREKFDIAASNLPSTKLISLIFIIFVLVKLDSSMQRSSSRIRQFSIFFDMNFNLSLIKSDPFFAIKLFLSKYAFLLIFLFFKLNSFIMC